MSNGLDPDQDRHSVILIWVQTVCKGYEETTLVDNESIVGMVFGKVNCQHRLVSVINAQLALQLFSSLSRQLWSTLSVDLYSLVANISSNLVPDQTSIRSILIRAHCVCLHGNMFKVHLILCS